MIDSYFDLLDRCDACMEREFSVWVDEDADFEEPIDDDEGG